MFKERTKSMNENLITYIENLTTKIINSYKIDIPIIDMKPVIKTIGGRIVYKKSYYDLIDGNIRKTGDKSFDILLPIFRKNDENNFIIACYLAHIFLHMGFRTDIELWNSMILNKQYKFLSLNKIEQEEWFALSLLMPKDIFVKIFYKHVDNDMVDVTEVANYFKVSINMVRKRAVCLKLLNKKYI